MILLELEVDIKTQTVTAPSASEELFVQIIYNNISVNSSDQELKVDYGFT
jgi:hypothetical protein